jgi:hypothetical protein
MKVKHVSVFLTIFTFISCSLYSQQVPLEFMIGNKFMSVDVNATAKFSDRSKFGFFHSNTLQVDLRDKAKDNFMIQDLLTYEIIDNLKATAGAFYGNPGFNTTLGMQYGFSNKEMSFLVAPRMNFKKEPSYEFMGEFQYKFELSGDTKLFGRVKLLSLFDANGNIKSYQWLRAGVEMSGIQFGLATDFDENGPAPSAEFNIGVFVRKEIFQK